MEVSGHLHAPVALLLGNVPSVPIGQEAVWAPERVWTLWSKEKFLALAGNRTPAVQPEAHRYTECAARAATLADTTLISSHIEALSNGFILKKARVR
jgi:hypothetical protein